MTLVLRCEKTLRYVTSGTCDRYLLIRRFTSHEYNKAIQCSREFVINTGTIKMHRSCYIFSDGRVTGNIPRLPDKAYQNIVYLTSVPWDCEALFSKWRLLAAIFASQAACRSTAFRLWAAFLKRKRVWRCERYCTHALNLDWPCEHPFQCHIEGQNKVLLINTSVELALITTGIVGLRQVHVPWRCCTRILGGIPLRKVEIRNTLERFLFTTY